MGVDYVIVSMPEKVTFECPHCEFDVEIPFEDVEYKSSYWNDGALVTCPNCGAYVRKEG